MIKFDKSIITNRPVEEVWKFISNVENLHRWNRGTRKGRVTSDSTIGVGIDDANSTPISWAADDRETSGLRVCAKQNDSIASQRRVAWPRPGHQSGKYIGIAD